MDIVAFKLSGDESKTYTKRIVGLPGETVTIQNGNLYIDGAEISLPEGCHSITLSGLAENGVTLGEEEYFMLGDNPDTSEDSRFANMGNVLAEQIEGRIWFRISPFDSLGFVK